MKETRWQYIKYNQMRQDNFLARTRDRGGIPAFLDSFFVTVSATGLGLGLEEPSRFCFVDDGLAWTAP